MKLPAHLVEKCGNRSRTLVRERGSLRPAGRAWERG